MEDSLKIFVRIFETYPSRIETFSPDLKITPQVADIFAMTSSDVSQVETALADARAELELLQSRNFTITEQTSEKTTFEIKPFPEGQAIKDRLMDSITKTLGKQRSHIFLESNKKHFNDQFSEFGNYERNTFEITWGKNPGEDKIKRMIRRKARSIEERLAKQGIPYNIGYGQGYQNLDSLPPTYRKLFTVENTAER